jgi:hypothetical protein
MALRSVTRNCGEAWGPTPVPPLSSLAGLWGATCARAEPSDVCRDLADRFAKFPQQLDVGSLTRLGSCVTTEIGDRLAAPEPPSPPASREEAVPPPARVG